MLTLEFPSGIGNVYALVYTEVGKKLSHVSMVSIQDVCHAVLPQAIWFHANVSGHVYLKYFYSEILDPFYNHYVHLVVVKPNFQEAKYSSITDLWTGSIRP